MDHSTTPASRTTPAEVDALLASGIFQPHWYAAQADHYFRTHRAAAEHFVRFGMPILSSPHLLLQPQLWPGDLQESWRRGEVRSVLQQLREDPEQQPPLGPLFYPKRLAVEPRLVAEHPGGSLGHFLATATDGDELPTPLARVRLGDVRATWQPTIERVKKQNKLVRRRTSTTWPHEREASWRASLRAPSPRQDGTPLFTIIMPAWNRAELIARAVRSVQEQTCAAWELIVVDDGSEDDTARIADSFARDDARITVIRAEHGGVSRARNRGLAAARGEFVAFLDTDNVWQPDYLELMAAGMTTAGATAAYAGIELRSEAEVTYRAFDGGLEHLLVVNHIDLNVMVVARPLAQALEFDPALRRWVDHDFAIRVAQREQLHLMPFIGCVYDSRSAARDRITAREPESWQWIVLGKHLVDWDVVQQRERVPGRVSVVIPVFQDWKLTHKAVASVLEHAGSHDVEVVLIDNGSKPHVGAALEQLHASERRVSYHRLPRNMNFGLGSNYGVAAASGEFICFLNNDTEVRPGWVDGLVPHLERPVVRGVQPLLVYPDESIQTAGTVFIAPESIPCHYLTGLPPEDALAATGESFSAVTAACLLMRTRELIDLRGFDPQFVNGMEDVDLCLRSIEREGGWFVVDPTVRVTHHESKTPGRWKSRSENRRLLRQRWQGRWPDLDLPKYAKAGLRVAEIGGDVDWVPLPQPTIVRDRDPERLRWGIRYASTGGERGNRWGDTFYANSLSAALRNHDQEVVSYRHGANTQVRNSLDDVNLVIRGLDPVPPIPGAVNILWVISHPSKVDAQELEAFDLVYAASREWSTQMSAAAGKPILPLMQATDDRIFHPPVTGTGSHHGPPTFVGSHFKARTRRIVADALAAGLDFRVIGANWDHLPPGHWEKDWVPNVELGDVYRSSSVVLADHWSDMAELGFLQNRIFDAVACATPVIVDSAAGLRHTFGSLVQTYDTPEALRLLCSPAGAARFGSPQERRDQAKDVLAHHSFAARATELVDAVRARLANRATARH